MADAHAAHAAHAVPAAAAPKVFNELFLAADEKAPPVPAVNACQWLIDGKLEPWTGATAPVFAPIFHKDTGAPVQLGVSPMMKEKDALRALDAARKAYGDGRGAWPTASPSVRIAALERFTAGLQARRNDIAALLMWEICKVQADAEKEVDRTIVYIRDTIKELKSLENRGSTFMSEGGIFAQVRRAPLGVVLCLGPFNYPFNETYATLIPALLMGNTCVMKLPRVGVLCHAPTLELFRDCFPAGVVNVIAGSGRETMPPLMKTGHVDVFAFIGTSKAADDLQKAHPKPHRLRVCLGLEAKNPAIVLPDADLATAVDECVLGALSFNGQRCTAIKIIFVHRTVADKFMEAFTKKVDALPMGLPWRAGVKITPLPEEAKPGYLAELIADAVKKGAHVANARGAKSDRTLVAPTVLYPVTRAMRCYHEEQFGPVVPVAAFERIEEVYEYLAESNYGQQAAVFSQDAHAVAPLLDVLVNQVSRVNLNCQCQRGPDSFPFTARKDSAYGTLSIADALRVFSIRSLVAAKQDGKNEALVNQIVSSRGSHFLRLDYLF